MAEGIGSKVQPSIDRATLLAYPAVVSGVGSACTETTVRLFSVGAGALQVTLPEPWKGRWCRILGSGDFSLLFGWDTGVVVDRTIAAVASAAGASSAHLGQRFIANVPEQFYIPTLYLSLQADGALTVEMALSSVYFNS